MRHAGRGLSCIGPPQNLGQAVTAVACWALRGVHRGQSSDLDRPLVRIFDGHQIGVTKSSSPPSGTSRSTTRLAISKWRVGARTAGILQKCSSKTPQPSRLDARDCGVFLESLPTPPPTQTCHAPVIGWSATCLLTLAKAIVTGVHRSYNALRFRE
jgi:hypothetical protein